MNCGHQFDNAQLGDQGNYLLRSIINSRMLSFSQNLLNSFSTVSQVSHSEIFLVQC